MTEEHDIIIKNGKIVDGTGAKRTSGDIAIDSGQISRITRKLDDNAKFIIKADGLIVCPGFIDMHSHSDTVLPFSNRLESTIHQGITTSVVGNCGISLAPVNEARIESIRKELDIFSPPGTSLDITWRSFGEYLEDLEMREIYWEQYNGQDISGSS